MYEKSAEKALQRLWEVTRGEKLSLLSICRLLQIKVKWTEGSHFSSGYAVVTGEKAYILLKSGQSDAECSATLAHELAHILLGHLGDWMDIEGRKLSSEQQEQEANHFASNILKLCE